MFDYDKYIGEHLKEYLAIITLCLAELSKMFKAKFLFFALVAIGIGTMGIWVPVVFKIDLSGSQPIHKEYNIVMGSDYSIENGNVIFTSSGKDESDSNAINNADVKIKYSNKSFGIENFSVFMYVIGILGILAAEHFIKNEKPENDDEEIMRSFVMCIWFIALVFSFWALKEPKVFTWQLAVSFWLSVSLWLSVTVNKSDFINLKKTNKSLSGKTIDSKDKNAFGGGGVGD